LQLICGACAIEVKCGTEEQRVTMMPLICDQLGDNAAAFTIVSVG